MPNHVVEVVGLRKVFPVRGSREARKRGLVAVDNISFNVEEGAALALIGESGSGKTTIARLVAGLEVPSGGTISVCGRARDRRRQSGRERRLRARELQMVFQNPYASLNPRQRVYEAIDEVVRFHFRPPKAERQHRVRQLLDQVGLGQRESQALPAELSGGQRQRVAIARALATQPQVLVLDEAVAALDVSIQAQVLNLLSDLRQGMRIAYLFLSHDLAVVRQVADSAIVLRAGKMVESGAVEQILVRPSDEYTRTLRDSVPRPGWRPQRVHNADLP